MATIRTTIYLSDTDRQAIAALQACYGLSTLSDAIRLAVRTLARHARQQAEEAAIGAEIAATTRAELKRSQAALAERQAEGAAVAHALQRAQDEARRQSSQPPDAGDLPGSGAKE